MKCHCLPTGRVYELSGIWLDTLLTSTPTGQTLFLASSAVFQVQQILIKWNSSTLRRRAWWFPPGCISCFFSSFLHFNRMELYLCMPGLSYERDSKVGEGSRSDLESILLRSQRGSHSHQGTVTPKRDQARCQGQCVNDCHLIHERQGSLNTTQKMNDFGATTEKCESNDSLVFWDGIK